VLKRSAGHLFDKRDGKDILNIDYGVLRAFLNTREFRHGVRSMEAIVAMSLLAGKTSYERSSLPSEAQMELHVDGKDFLVLVQRMQLEGELLEKLAASAHAIYCEGLTTRGYTWGADADDTQKISPSLVAYFDLPEDLKEQNRSNVRDIAQKLTRTGYGMIPARSNEPPFEFPGQDLDLLAEIEHERWIAAKLAGGWRYAAQSDPIQKLSEALLPWDQLPEAQKEKDRDLVRGIPKILAQAGYAIVRL